MSPEFHRWQWINVIPHNKGNNHHLLIANYLSHKRLISNIYKQLKNSHVRKNYLVNKWTSEVDSSQKKLQMAKGYLENIQHL